MFYRKDSWSPIILFRCKFPYTFVQAKPFIFKYLLNGLAHTKEWVNLLQKCFTEWLQWSQSYHSFFFFFLNVKSCIYFKKVLWHSLRVFFPIIIAFVFTLSPLPLSLYPLQLFLTLSSNEACWSLPSAI